MTIDGYCDPRFTAVRDVFARGFAEGRETGAAYAVFLDGRKVVDLWGGVADRTTGRPWEPSTPVLTYSCTKGVAATALLLLVERGELDLAAPVRDYWPEFRSPAVTVEHVLTHQAGLPVLEERVPVEEFEDLPALAARLAGQEPLWRPGTAHGYHVMTFGWLVDELIRRVTGRSTGELVAKEFAGPYGLDMWLGAPPEVIERAALLTAEDRPASPVPGDPAAEARRDRDSLLNRAFGNPRVVKLPQGANSPVILRAGWPAMGLVATARGLAGFYRDLIAGRFLRPATLTDAIRPRVSGPDLVTLGPSTFGLGYVPHPAADSAFGHSGMGGSIGLGDVEKGLGAAYVMNRLANPGTMDPRAWRLVLATYECL